ncbi:MBL fold metallo-hydrolase [Noviherbaspirillum sedimenti]|uniref:MBL fold metallo-hydrolase n=1 Tax=Noviherbaspirillum sedimenti TaxID=2320865 RepID=A0A3A3FWQ9_9BURK|nr:MBL fold metallo-hydrolase [Noviherbaspirillum sedimenti]RJG00663.1 MBL fold metallo-hydrolase [Noviherbaspirillum sedimenti]
MTFVPQQQQTSGHPVLPSQPATSDGRPDLTLGLKYPIGAPPAVGEAIEVAPGVLWLRMPLPFALDHINVWAIADEDDHGLGWAIVDTGIMTSEATEAWCKVLSPHGPLAATTQGARVTRVLVTHMHPDHVGMAGWLTRKFGCRLWMARLEYLTCRVLAADTGREAPDDAVRFYRAAGWAEDALDRYRARFGGFGRHMHVLPDSFMRLSDGDCIQFGRSNWRVIIGRGHSPEHVCLLNEEQSLLISGDQVLPRISSNVSVFPSEPEANPLNDWLTSVASLRKTLSNELLVLPAHGEPFLGLHARLDRMTAGHQNSLSRLRQSLSEPLRVVDVFGALFARKINDSGEELGLATGEALAHLNYLLARREITRLTDANGVMRYMMK